MKIASFFSGIGGFDLGFERAGHEVVYQCEKEKFCQRILRHHASPAYRSEIGIPSAGAFPLRLRGVNAKLIT
ncbi:MAG: DNA cytosine methyltransferase [Proteobacteria bacterium]|nr:MAG: DNA cytosine methyltransferase [Pseudomonadota bacterium]